MPQSKNAEKEDRASVICFMVTRDGVQHNFTLEEFRALFKWIDEILEEWKMEVSEENLEKAIYEIFNNRTGEEEPS